MRFMKENAGGYALIITLVALTILTMLGIALTFNSMTDAKIANNYEAESLANMIAEAGLNRALLELRGRGFATTPGGTYTAVLVGPNGVPDSTAEVASFLFDYRNPIPMNQANRSQLGSIDPRLLDITNAGQLTTATVNDDGIVSTIGQLGVPYYVDPGPDGIFGTADDLTYFGNERAPSPQAVILGRYFVKVSNNPDDPGGPFKDTDFTLIVRAMGIARSMPGETAISSTNTRNSVSIVETRIRMDTTFQTNSPFTVMGSSVAGYQTNFFNGASGSVSGGGFLGMSVIDATGNTDLTGPTNNSMTDQIRSARFSSKVTGSNPPAGAPSIANITGFVQNGQTWSGVPNPDITNVLNPNYVGNMVFNLMPTYADQVLTGAQACNALQGDLNNPSFIYVCGDVICAGNVSGGGILVVTGSLQIGGSLSFNGVILAIGAGAVKVHGATSITGGIWDTNLTCNPGGVCSTGSGTGCSFGQTRFTLDGNVGGASNTDFLNMGLSLLPFNVKGWRVIHPEMEL